MLVLAITLIAIPHNAIGIEGGFAPPIFQFQADQQSEQDFEIVELQGNELPAQSSGQAESPNKTYRAFVAWWRDPEFKAEREILIIEDRSTNRAFRVRSLWLPHRLIENLRWTHRTKVRFDIWAGPHFGHRYELNVSTKKISHLKFLRG